MLDNLAAELGYSARHMFMNYHMPHLAARWVDKGLPVVERRGVWADPGLTPVATLLDLTDVMAPSELAANRPKVRRLNPAWCEDEDSVIEDIEQSKTTSHFPLCSAEMKQVWW